MTEIILLIVILSLIGFIVWRESECSKHIKELEKRVATVSPSGDTSYPFVPRKSEPNPIAKPEENEVMLGEIPFMEIPKDFKIEKEGGPETPHEARARKDE